MHGDVFGTTHLQPKVCQFIQAYLSIYSLSIAIRAYEPQVRHFAQEMEQILAGKTGQPVVVNSYFYWFGFDVMGFFAFAKPFYMLRDGKWHDALLKIRNGLALLGYLTPVPWVGHLAFHIPFLPPVKSWNTMVEWCGCRMEERLEVMYHYGLFYSND